MTESDLESQRISGRRKTKESMRLRQTLKDALARRSSVKEQLNANEHLDENLLEFYNKIISLRRQHGLAHIRFRALEAACHSNLLILLALSSGVMSFLTSIGGYGNGTYASGTHIKDTDQAMASEGMIGQNPIMSPRTREILSILVGGFCFLQVAIQKLGKTWNYGARSDMHKEAANSLDALMDKFEFDHKKNHGYGKHILEESVNRLQRYQDVFEQCVSSVNNSPLPVRIRQTFTLLNTELPLFLSGELRLNPRSEPEVYRLLYLHAFNELFNEVSDHVLWPWYIVAPRKAVRKVIHNVRRKNRDYNFDQAELERDNDYLESRYDDDDDTRTSSLS